MDELIARIAQAADIAPETARNALGLVLNFIEKEAPEQAGAFMNYIPDAQELMASASRKTSGGIGGMIGGLLGSLGNGGGLMALGSQLLEQGLSIDQARTVAAELLDFGRTELGDERIAELMKAIPGLSQLI